MQRSGASAASGSVLEKTPVLVVLDQHDVVPHRGLEQGLAAAGAERDAGRVLQRRHQIGDARPGAPGGAGEGVDVEPAGIDRHRHEAQVQMVRDRDRAGVGDGFGEHGVAGPGQRRQCREQAVLCAGGDDDLVDRGRHAAQTGPARHHAPMALVARVRLVLEQRRQQVRIDRRGGGDQLAAEGRRQQLVQRQIGDARRRLRRRRVHEGAASDGRRHQAAAPRFAIGPRDGGDCRAEALGQLTLRRQPGVRGDAAGGDVGGQRIHDAQVERPGPGSRRTAARGAGRDGDGRKLRLPHCPRAMYALT